MQLLYKGAQFARQSSGARGVSPGAGRAFVGCMQSHLVHELTLDPDTAQRMHAHNDEAIAAAKDAHQAKAEL